MGDGGCYGGTAPYVGGNLDSHERYDWTDYHSFDDPNLWDAEVWVDDEQWEPQQAAKCDPPLDDNDENDDFVPALESMLAEQPYWSSTWNSIWVLSLLSFRMWYVCSM